MCLIGTLARHVRGTCSQHPASPITNVTYDVRVPVERRGHTTCCWRADRCRKQDKYARVRRHGHGYFHLYDFQYSENAHLESQMHPLRLRSNRLHRPPSTKHGHIGRRLSPTAAHHPTRNRASHGGDHHAMAFINGAAPSSMTAAAQEHPRARACRVRTRWRPLTRVLALVRPR